MTLTRRRPSYNPGIVLRRLAIVAWTGVFACLASTPVAAQTQTAWEQWQHLVGIVDVGARDDGTLVAMVAGHLFTVAPDTGAATPFADGPGGFSADPSVESYFVVATNQGVENAGLQLARRRCVRPGLDLAARHRPR